MKAIILAAGMSNRLMQLTKSKPKCLIEIHGKTILEYQIENLRKYGIKDIMVVIGYQKDRMINILKQRDINYIINKDYEKTNSSYSLWLAREEFANHDFIYLNSDLYFSELILGQLITNRTEFSCIVDKNRKQKEIDSFRAVMHSLKILDMGKKVDSDIEVPGPFYISQSTSKILFEELDIIIKIDKNMWVYSIFNKLSKKIDLRGIYTDLPWIELDTVDDYYKAKELDLEKGPQVVYASFAATSVDV